MRTRRSRLLHQGKNYSIICITQSFDVTSSGTAEVTIGPIRLDPSVKTLVDGALYSRSLRSQIKVTEKHQFRNADMVLTDKVIQVTE